MYLAHIVSGVAVALAVGPEADPNYFEITAEQFNTVELPCRAEVTEDGVVFGDVVPWTEVPDVGVPGEGELGPIPEPELTVWDEMDAAYQEGVNDV